MWVNARTCDRKNSCSATEKTKSVAQSTQLMVLSWSGPLGAAALTTAYAALDESSAPAPSSSGGAVPLDAAAPLDSPPTLRFFLSSERCCFLASPAVPADLADLAAFLAAFIAANSASLTILPRCRPEAGTEAKGSGEAFRGHNQGNLGGDNPRLPQSRGGSRHDSAPTLGAEPEGKARRA